jgi:hypothetical protein
VKGVVEKAIWAMSDAEEFLRHIGLRQGQAADVAFTCGLKVGRLERTRLDLEEHETRRERAQKARRK